LERGLDATKLKAAVTYNAAADCFDADALGFWDRVGRRTIELLDLEAGASVLDVGCGSGASALPAAGRVGPGGQVIGVDLAERLVELGRRKAAALGLTNIAFEVGDMERLGYPDGRFDAVVSVFSIFFVPDIVGMTRELWRMVRPGGRLAITTWGPRMLEPGTSLFWDVVHETRPDLVPSVSPWDRIVATDALRTMMEAAGVADAKIFAEEGSQPLMSPEDWWTIVLGSGFRWTVDQLGPEAAREARARNLERVERQRIDSVETNALFAIAQKPALNWLKPA